MRVEISRQPEAGFQTTRQQHYKRCGRECDLPAAKAQNDLPAAKAQKCQIGLVPSQCTSWQRRREAARDREQRSTSSSCSRHRMCTSASGTMKGASQPPRRCAHGILAVFSHGRAKHQTAFPKQACDRGRLESKRTKRTSTYPCAYGQALPRLQLLWRLKSRQCALEYASFKGSSPGSSGWRRCARVMLKA